MLAGWAVRADQVVQGFVQLGLETSPKYGACPTSLGQPDPFPTTWPTSPHERKVSVSSLNPSCFRSVHTLLPCHAWLWMPQLSPLHRLLESNGVGVRCPWSCPCSRLDKPCCLSLCSWGNAPALGIVEMNSIQVIKVFLHWGAWIWPWCPYIV